VIEDLIGRMQGVLSTLETAGDRRRYFHATYQRTTVAVAEELRRGGFLDPDWVERWDVAFADLYLDALEAAMDGRPVPRPWDIAFNAPAGLPALRHVLLGMNAHINYDLPQALVAVITDEQFGDAALLARREADHRAIDRVLAARVGAEDDELARMSGPTRPVDRLLGPLNRLGTQRFLREAREKVWANAIILNRARGRGAADYAAALARLEELSAAKVAALVAPGQVLLKLAITGFGVRLPSLMSDGQLACWLIFCRSVSSSRCHCVLAGSAAASQQRPARPGKRPGQRQKAGRRNRRNSRSFLPNVRWSPWPGKGTRCLTAASWWRAADRMACRPGGAGVPK
jgi:hypothetical protein